MKLRTMLLSGMAFAMVGMGPLLSARAASAQGGPQGSAMMEGHEMMAKGAKGTEMPQACQEMMAARQSMRAERAKQDARLNELVAKMNAATGQKKVDAIAAVVSEMVAQRQAKHEKMAAMHSKWKKGIEGCPGAEGCPGMEGCPRMQKGAGGGKTAPAEKKAE